MTIAEELDAISTKLDTLDGKVDGNLVRFNDWNDLVDQVKALGTIVNTQQENYVTNDGRIETLEVEVLTEETGLKDRVTAIDDLIGASGDEEGTIVSRLETVEEDKLDKETFTQYQATLDPLLLQYTVTLETEDVNYLLGETATLTATVRRLDGSAVSTRPWLDFLVSWGDIQAISGFETRPGAGGRSVSVRTNSDGVARVRIKAEYLARTSAGDDDEIQAFFATEISAQNQTKMMRQAIMEAADPQDNFMRVMYAETSQRYDSGAPGIQAVTDQYYLGNYREWTSDIVFHGGSWKNYRSTIAVFAKDDSNPETPDFGKGVSSIQINFRDWIGPWIDDYRPEVPFEEGPWILEIPPLLQDPAYRPEILIDYIDDHVKGLGLLAKHKTLESLGGAIVRVDESLINPGAGRLRDVIGDAMKTQKNLDFVTFGNTAAGGGDLVSMSQAVQQAAGTGIVQGKVDSVEIQMEGINSKTTNLEDNYGVLNDRINETSVQGENVMLALGSIDNKVGNINVVDADSVRGGVSAARAEIAALHNLINR